MEIKSGKTMWVTKSKSVKIWNTYSLIFGNSPSCDCPFKLNNHGDVCRHIIWALINIFKVSEENQILYQVGYTSKEL